MTSERKPVAWEIMWLQSHDNPVEYVRADKYRRVVGNHEAACATVEQLEAEIARLREENERLREALGHARVQMNEVHAALRYGGIMQRLEVAIAKADQSLFGDWEAADLWGVGDDR